MIFVVRCIQFYRDCLQQIRITDRITLKQSRHAVERLKIVSMVIIIIQYHYGLVHIINLTIQNTIGGIPIENNTQSCGIVVLKRYIITSKVLGKIIMNTIEECRVLQTSLLNV